MRANCLPANSVAVNHFALGRRRGTSGCAPQTQTAECAEGIPTPLRTLRAGDSERSRDVGGSIRLCQDFTESTGLNARLNALADGHILPHDPVKALRRSVASIKCDSRLTAADADLADLADAVDTR